MKNSDYNTLDVKARCESKLGISFKNTQGKRAPHFKGWFVLDGKKTQRITIPKGRKPIPPKTYGSMAKQLGIEIEKFDDLLDCPLEYDEYVKLIKAHN